MFSELGEADCLGSGRHRGSERYVMRSIFDSRDIDGLHGEVLNAINLCNGIRWFGSSRPVGSRYDHAVASFI